MKNVIKHFVKTSVAVVAAAGLAACSDYEVKFNERSVYTPAPLFSDYRLEDQALKDCVQQTIKDKRVTGAEDLEVLVCTNAGITSLAGLATFDGLQQLNLADNAIAEVEPLTQLAQLTRVDLSNNALRQVAPLMTLAELKQLNLAGNPALNCVQANQLRANSDADVRLPEHCE